MLFISIPTLGRESWDHPIYRWEDWGDKWEPGSCAKVMAKEGFEPQALCLSPSGLWPLKQEVQKHGIVIQGRGQAEVASVLVEMALQVIIPPLTSEMPSKFFHSKKVPRKLRGTSLEGMWGNAQHCAGYYKAQPWPVSRLTEGSW